MFYCTWHISDQLQELALWIFFCLVYCFSLDSGIEFLHTAAAAAAERQGRAWLVSEMKQTEQGRLFIRSKRIIVKKVTAATAGNKWAACWCAQWDVEAVRWWCRQVRKMSERLSAIELKDGLLMRSQNRYTVSPEKRSNILTFWHD